MNCVSKLSKSGFCIKTSYSYKNGNECIKVKNGLSFCIEEKRGLEKKYRRYR